MLGSSMGRKTRIAVLSGLGFLLVAVLAAYLYFRNEVYTVVMTQAELQQRADAMFPLRKAYLGLFEIEYANPTIELDPRTNRVRASVDAVTLFTVEGRKFTGSATASGSLRYDNQTGAFFLDHITVERMALGGIPDRYVNKLDGLASALLTGHYQQHPIYALHDDRLKQRLAKALLKSVVVRDGAVIATLGL
jgi:hypothetical protein